MKYFIVTASNRKMLNVLMNNFETFGWEKMNKQPCRFEVDKDNNGRFTVEYQMSMRKRNV